MTQDEMQAVDRGAADYFAGNHSNPYAFNSQESNGNLFRAWIVGYNAARATEDAIAKATGGAK